MLPVFWIIIVTVYFTQTSVNRCDYKQLIGGEAPGESFIIHE